MATKRHRRPDHQLDALDDVAVETADDAGSGRVGEEPLETLSSDLTPGASPESDRGDTVPGWRRHELTRDVIGDDESFAGDGPDRQFTVGGGVWASDDWEARKLRSDDAGGDDGGRAWVGVGAEASLVTNENIPDWDLLANGEGLPDASEEPSGIMVIAVSHEIIQDGNCEEAEFQD